MSLRRVLIVTADDFGRTDAVNEGVAEAHELGIVTSASLMVRWSAAAEAAATARRLPALAVGLHIDLAEWRVDGRGEWEPSYEVVDVTDEAAVRRELGAQLEAFRDLTGRDPTHLDSHQHTHREEPVRSAVAAMAEVLGVPAREITAGPRYVGGFYGAEGGGASHPEWISVAALVELLGGLPPGVTELGCHPSCAVELELGYASERVLELATLCDPVVRASLDSHGIGLRSFADLSR